MPRIHEEDRQQSEMTTSINSDASNDMDLVKHHDGNSSPLPLPPCPPVGTSCCNLLDPISSESESESESSVLETLEASRARGASKTAGQGLEPDPLTAWLGVSWLIMYLMFILFLLYKRKPGPVH